MREVIVMERPPIAGAQQVPLPRIDVGHRHEQISGRIQDAAQFGEERSGPREVLDDVTDPWVYGELLRVLGRLDHPDAVRKLVDVSLYDSSVDLRELALDLLTRNGRRVPILPYVRALKNADNKVVNRAGKALALIGDPEAVSPLIDALTTEHKYKVQTGNPGGINAGMVNGSGGFSMGGDGPKIITKALDNPAVLQALTKLTGEHNLEYDESAWRSWFVNQQERALSSARRDK